MDLVEREAALQTLEDCLGAVASGTGRAALIAGEAGVGKTSLIKALAARHRDVSLWWGGCDALQTPHPLAPFHDIARSADVRFGALLSADGNRAALFDAVLVELQQSRRPTLVIIEDAHWADDATLDLVKFVGRRVDRAACLLVISYRDDEVHPTHKLRRVLGELPPDLLTRLDLAPLSPAAVDLLARRALRSPAGLHAVTRGNPFFVTELLRHGVDGVPRSVQDLVLARLSRLSARAREVIALCAVVPGHIERWLVDELAGVDAALIEECLNSGLLMADASTLSFRHELARVAVETSLSAPVARALHGSVLDALERRRGAPVSLARLTHHASHAGDRAAVRRLAPEAARQAERGGAHREAAAHYRTALEHVGDADEAERASWLAALARECQTTDQLDEAISVRLRLDEHYRQVADTAGEAENLSELAVVHVLALRNAEADAASRRAIDLLQHLPPGVQLANAYRVEAHLRMLNRDCDAAIQWSTQAIELAERFGQRETCAAALATRGTALLFSDYDEGRAQLERALELALAEGFDYIAANIYSNLGSGSGEVFRLHEAERHLRRAIAFAQRHEIDFYRNYATAWLALCELYLGRWDDAAASAAEVTQRWTGRSTSRVMALVAQGRLQTRRGDPAPVDVLDEALELAVASNTLQRLGPVRAARAERAWWRGDLHAAADEARSALQLAVERRHPWLAGELALWLHRAGALTSTPTPCAEPFVLQIAGRWRDAAATWSRLGCPYEQASALADGDAEGRLEAFHLFTRLGARPAADRQRERLLADGHRVPRGLRPSTRGNPHRLTARELEVLALLCEGLKNSEIAERLRRSVRTVDHHLAAVFGKLGATSRGEAVAIALREGIRPQNGRRRAPN